MDQTKPSILLDMAKLYDVFCICLTKTHLSENVMDSEISKDGWNIFRTDRKDRICGGVSITKKMKTYPSKKNLISQI